MSVQDRRDREREERSREILDAAERLFLQHGFSATMDQIATEVGVAKGTLYLYYASKEDLLLKLLSRGLDIFILSLQQIPQEMSPIDKILAVGDAYVRFSQENPQHFTLLNDTDVFITQTDISIELLEEVYRKSSTIWSIITGFLQDGIDQGVFRSDLSPFEMAIILWTNTTGIIRQINFMNKSNIWQRKRDSFSMYNLDFQRILKCSHRILIDGLQTRES